jgi:hypothetical protein
VDFSFAGLDLHAGELYAIVLGPPASNGYIWVGDAPGSYAGGELVSGDGTNWSVYADYNFDVGFSVTAKFVVPEPSTFVYCGLISLLVGVCGSRVRRRPSRL